MGYHKQAQHTGVECNSEQVVVPIVVHWEAAEVVNKVVAHREVAVAAQNLGVAVGWDHKTWLNSSCQKCTHFYVKRCCPWLLQLFSNDRICPFNQKSAKTHHVNT